MMRPHRALARSSALLAAALLSARAAHAEPPGAAAIWHFDDAAATVSDASGNGNVGTFVGAAGYTMGGSLPPVAGNVAGLKLGGGTAHVTVPNSASLTMPGSWTITAWVRLDQMGTGVVLSKDSNSYFTNYNTWVYNNHLRTVVSFTSGPAPIASSSGGNGGCDPGGCWVDTAASFVDANHPLGTWRHVGFSYDNATKTLSAYLDCSKASATYTTPAGIYTGNEAAQIGQRKSNGEPAIVGAMDEVKIWPRVLSAAEIVDATGCLGGCCGVNACGGCEPPAPLGSACMNDAGCASGHCADGVCCDSACNGGPCDACSVAAGAAKDGVCKALDGAACNDGNACTQTDACQGGVCVGGNVVMCPPAEGCYAETVCDPATGLCAGVAKMDGAACDDGDACTTGDMCMGGACMAGSPVQCPAPDECHEAGVCGANGDCTSAAKPNGTSCLNGTCQDGVCVGGGSASSSASTTTSSANSTSSGVGGTGGMGGGGAGGNGGNGGSDTTSSASTTTTNSASSTTGSGAGGTGGTGGNGDTPHGVISDSGCGCRVAGSEQGNAGAWLAVGIAAIAITARRRQRV